MEKSPTFDKVVTIIEQAGAELVELCLRLGNTPSPHGKERIVGQAVLDWLKRYGIDGQLQIPEVLAPKTPTRSSAWWPTPIAMSSVPSRPSRHRRKPACGAT